MTLTEIMNCIHELVGNEEIVLRHRYERDGGHGDMVEVSFVMLTYDGEHPYYIHEGKLSKEELGFECAIFCFDSSLEETLYDLYLNMKSRLEDFEWDSPRPDHNIEFVSEF
jgi:hypothetical protein